MTDDHAPIMETPPEVQAAVNATRRTRRSELALVVFAVLAALGLVSATAYSTFRLRALASQNVKAQEFGLKAIDCILDNLADHRWSNQVFHDNLAAYLKAPQTPHVPLPLVPTDDQFAADCSPFNLRTEVREGNGGPIVTSPTSTTEVHHDPTTSR